MLKRDGTEILSLVIRHLNTWFMPKKSLKYAWKMRNAVCARPAISGVTRDPGSQ